MPLDHYLTLGRSGLRVSPLCLGTMTFGEDLGEGDATRYTDGRSMTNSYEIGKKYVALVKEGRREECLSTLFSQDAVSVEAAEFPGRERTVEGLEGLRAKSKFFLDNNEVHKLEVFGPYPNDERFIVRFVMEVTFKPNGQRRAIDEVGLFTVADGKIAREEFFYPVT